MKKQFVKPLTIGSVVALSAAISAHGFAAENPFSVTSLKAGYQLAGEGSCGDSKAKQKEGSCGDAKAKKADGSCGDAKKEATKKKDGSCGEGKCGEGKKKAKEAEGSCGDKK